MEPAISREHQRLCKARCECDVGRVAMIHAGGGVPVTNVPARDRNGYGLPENAEAITVVNVEVRWITVEASPDAHERLAVPTTFGDRIAVCGHETPRAAACGGDPQLSVASRVIEN